MENGRGAAGAREGCHRVQRWPIFGNKARCCIRSGAARDSTLERAVSISQRLGRHTCRACDVARPRITVRRVPWRGDPRLPVLQIQVRRAA